MTSDSGSKMKFYLVSNPSLSIYLLCDLYQVGGLLCVSESSVWKKGIIIVLTSVLLYGLNKLINTEDTEQCCRVLSALYTWAIVIMIVVISIVSVFVTLRWCPRRPEGSMQNPTRWDPPVFLHSLRLSTHFMSPRELQMPRSSSPGVRTTLKINVHPRAPGGAFQGSPLSGLFQLPLPFAALPGHTPWVQAQESLSQHGPLLSSLKGERATGFKWLCI